MVGDNYTRHESCMTKSTRALGGRIEMVHPGAQAFTASYLEYSLKQHMAYIVSEAGLPSSHLIRITFFSGLTN
jgi:hypothetical protein